MNFIYEPDTSILTLKFPQDILSTNVESTRSKTLNILEIHPPKDWQCLQLDFSEIKLIDSAGLNFVVFLMKQAKEEGAIVRARVVNTNLKRTFQFTRLNQHMELVEDF